MYPWWMCEDSIHHFIISAGLWLHCRLLMVHIWSKQLEHWTHWDRMIYRLVWKPVASSTLAFQTRFYLVCVVLLTFHISMISIYCFELLSLYFDSHDENICGHIQWYRLLDSVYITIGLDNLPFSCEFSTLTWNCWNSFVLSDSSSFEYWACESNV